MSASTVRTPGTRSHRLGRVLRAFVATGVAVASAGAVAVVAAPAAQAATPVTYQDFTYPSTVTAPTADKPQSKVWRNDGAWWAVLISTTQNVPTIHELRSDHTWRDTGVVLDTRASSTADVEWTGGKLYTVSRTASSSTFVRRYSYSSGSRSYSLDSGFPVTVATGGSESAALARDSTGVLWVTWTKSSSVWFAHTTLNDTTWSTGAKVPAPDTTIAADDISGIVSFSNKIGIMWSDQQSAADRFAIHVDGTADTQWTIETPLSGAGIADDHMNLKSIADDPQGRVFAAVKTSYGDNGEPSTFPLILVLQRAADGTWTRATGATVADDATRPQVMIDSEHSTLYLMMTAPTTPGGTIYYKTSPLSSLSFPTGKGSVFMKWSGAVLNNVSTSKDPVTSSTGLVAIAGDDANHRYYHTELSLGAATGDTTPPVAPASMTATATSATSVDLAWPAGSDNVGVTGYNVFRNGSPIGSTTGALTFTDTTAQPSSTYTYGVQAVDAANNKSSTTSSNSVTTPSAPPPPPPGGGITFEAASTASSGNGTSLTVSAPAGTAAGDVLLATVSSRGSATVSAPAGWSPVIMTANGTTMRQTVFVKVGGASEPSVTFTLSKTQAVVAQVVAYSGVDTTTPVAASAGQANASSTTVTAPAVTAGAGDVVVGLFGIARSIALAPASPLVERSEVLSPSTATYKVSGEVSDRTAAAAGSYGPLTATATTGSASVGQAVVLNAA